jgi:hypothetical protein
VKIVARAIDESSKMGRRHLDRHQRLQFLVGTKPSATPERAIELQAPFRGSFCATSFVLGPSNIHIVGEELS